MALVLVRLAGVLVPADERSDWIREWEAELLGRWSDAGRTGSRVTARFRLAGRALGSFVDAARLRARHGLLVGMSGRRPAGPSTRPCAA